MKHFIVAMTFILLLQKRNIIFQLFSYMTIGCVAVRVHIFNKRLVQSNCRLAINILKSE